MFSLIGGGFFAPPLSLAQDAVTHLLPLRTIAHQAVNDESQESGSCNIQPAFFSLSTPGSSPLKTGRKGEEQWYVALDERGGEEKGLDSGLRTEELPDARQKRNSHLASLLAGITIFTLASFVGIEVINKVPPTLHTPLMSGSNAISGITVVGSIILSGCTDSWFAAGLGFLATILAMINVVGGFVVTDRMLAMFQRGKK